MALTAAYAFETGNNTGDFIQSKGTNVAYSTTVTRKMADSHGGNQTLKCNSASSITTTGAGTAIMEVFPYHVTAQKCSFAIYGEDVSCSGRIFFCSGSTEVFSVRTDGLGVLTLKVNGSDVATGSSLITSEQFHLLEVGYLIDNSGSVVVKLNGVEEINYSGDTNNAGTYIDNIRLGGKIGFYFEDCVLYDPYWVLRYDGGAGTAPVAGDTITASGGKTGTVKSHVGDGVTGRLVLDTASAFADNDAITNGSWTANALGAINDDYTDWPGEVYLEPTMTTAVGTTNQFTASAGTTESCIDDIGSTSDYIEAGTDGYKSTFTVDDLPNDKAVAFVMVEAYASKNGAGIDHMRGILRVGGTDYESDEQHSLNTSYTWHHSLWYKRPSDHAAIDYNDIDEIGVQAET